MMSPSSILPERQLQRQNLVCCEAHAGSILPGWRSTLIGIDVRVGLHTAPGRSLHAVLTKQMQLVNVPQESSESKIHAGAGEEKMSQQGSAPFLDNARQYRQVLTV